MDDNMNTCHRARCGHGRENYSPDRGDIYVPSPLVPFTAHSMPCSRSYPPPYPLMISTTVVAVAADAEGVGIKFQLWGLG